MHAGRPRYRVALTKPSQSGRYKNFEMIESKPARPEQSGASSPPTEKFATRVPRAEWAFKARRMRDRIFGGELFGEPAWDLLLLLATARENGEMPTVARIALDIHLPREVAQRTVTRLVQAGLVSVPSGHAVEFAAPVDLTDEGLAKLQTVLG